MITIEIDNSYSRIKGLKTQEFRAIRKLLSYESDPKAAYFSGGWKSRKYLIDKEGNFPTGLLDKIYDWLYFKKSYKVIDHRKNPGTNTIEIKPTTEIAPYKWQREAVDAAVKAQRGGIVASTGTGKSLVIALIASRLSVKTLIVVPTLEIKKQLTETLLGLFGENKNIVVENIDSTRLIGLMGFDCLIIDECHHVAAKTYQKLNKTVWKGIYYRFFLTATYFRNNESEQLLFEGIAGAPIYRLDYKRAVDEGYIVPVEAYYFDLQKQSTDAFTWREVYNELIVNNHQRNYLIAALMLNLSIDKASTLCLVKEIQHGKILSKLTGIPFASGEDESSRKFIEVFNESAITSLIGTTGILGEGIDTKPAEYVIIAGLGKAKSAFLQQIGRGVRKYPGKKSCKIILFRDKSHKFTMRHFNEQKKILLEELDVSVVELPEREDHEKD